MHIQKLRFVKVPGDLDKADIGKSTRENNNPTLTPATYSRSMSV